MPGHCNLYQGIREDLSETHISTEMGGSKGANHVNFQEASIPECEKAVRSPQPYVSKGQQECPCWS